MIGCIGVAPAGGEMSTVMPSYPTGGNMDLTDAAPGSTVYLPVQVTGALLSIGDIHAVMSRGESSFVAIEAAGSATVSVDLVKGLSLRAPRIDTGEDIVCVGLGDPVQDSIAMAYESLFAVLVDEHGFSREDAYVTMSALAHTELGGPTGSTAPDPVHPFRAVGAVTLAEDRQGRAERLTLGRARLMARPRGLRSGGVGQQARSVGAHLLDGAEAPDHPRGAVVPQPPRAARPRRDEHRHPVHLLLTSPALGSTRTQVMVLSSYH